MMVTTWDDDLLRSHDEVLDLLRYALPGVRVRVEPVALPGTARAAQSTRRLTLTVDRVGRDPLVSADLYSLPCRSGPILARARELVDRAESCAHKEERITLAP